MTDSTSDRAREYAKSFGKSLPAVFVAEGQTAGRGRRGRSFNSEKGKGLYMTLVFEPAPEACDSVFLTVRAAVCLARAIRKLSGLTVGIKWVNDIFCNSRKLAGILAEGEFLQGGGMAYAMIGVGVNLLSREFPPELSDVATTLEDECGKRISPRELARTFVHEFFDVTDNADLIAEYRTLSVVIGKEVTVRRISGEEFFATVLDVTDTGALLVRREDGSEEALISAEVSIKSKEK